MQALRLHGHRGQSVEIDHCRACRQVWFDALESVHLSGLGWIELLREMAPGRPAADGGPAPLPEVGERPALACPRCAEPLKPVHNQTRWGRFPALECPRQHGHLQGDAGLLAERGLVRPLLPAEWRALEDERRTLGCLACGAAAQRRQADCAWCGSPLLVLNLPRLAHALRQRMGHWTDLPSPAGTPLPWPCRACGQTLDPTRHSQCPQCGHGVVAPALADIAPLLAGAEQELRQAANHPARPRPPRPPRHWRDTGLGMLRRWLRLD